MARFDRGVRPIGFWSTSTTRLTVGWSTASAGSTPPTDWHLSPIYGDLSGLKKVTTFVGTREILLPDNALFHAKLLEAGVDSTLHVGESLNHVYPMFPTPEGRRARRDLVRIVTGELA